MASGDWRCKATSPEPKVQNLPARRAFSHAFIANPHQLRENHGLHSARRDDGRDPRRRVSNFVQTPLSHKTYADHRHHVLP